LETGVTRYEPITAMGIEPCMAVKKTYNWLLDPDDPALRKLIAGFVDELREFEGRQYGEFFEEVEEKNRLEKREAIRRLRMETARLLAETTGTTSDRDVIPQEIRIFVFRSLWKRGRSFITSEADLFNPTVDELLNEAARHFELSEDTIRSLFYADIPEEQHIVLPDIPPPPAIMQMLNTRRLRQKLRSASSLLIRIPAAVEESSPYVAMFWLLKRLGLMYDVQMDNDNLILTVTGPLALFEKTTVYGNRFATFVVHILERFGESKGKNTVQIEAVVEGEAGRKAVGRRSVLKMDPSYSRYFTKYESQVDEKLLRSGDEVAFQRYFEKAAQEWTIVYEGTIVPLYDDKDRYSGIFVPDFVLHNTEKDQDVLVEIVGYWREEYLRRKIEKMKMIRGREVYFFINAKLNVGGGMTDIDKDIPSNVRIRYYSGRRDLKQVIQEMVGEMNTG